MALPRMRAAALAGCLLLVATLAGCARKTTVEALLKDPAHFDRQKVAIEGTVKNPLGIFDYGAYEVDDGTGRLTVLAKKGGAPREGTKVGVTGEFHSGFTLGTQTAAMLVEKERQLK